VSLSLGEGAVGLGRGRHVPGAENVPEQRIPRNAPALFNLGATEYSVMFHDGRLEIDADQPGGMRSPLGVALPEGLDSLLAAQSMFPVLSADEMAGHYSENEVAEAVRLGQSFEAWDRIAARVAAEPGYRPLFDGVYGNGSEIRYVEIANALAAFMDVEWRAVDSPFDRYLTEGTPLSPLADKGRALFYGRAQCSTCHSGWFQTDHSFHAIALPQIGPGKAARFENHARDEGRMRVTGRAEDAYAFRTPSLRNVTLTAPYGHDGAYASLSDMVRHHLDPVPSLMGYQSDKAVFLQLEGAEDWKAQRDQAELSKIAAASDLTPVVLNDGDITAILAFLKSLEDLSWQNRLGVPEAVPSGLPVDR
jgi:cytochrome c peroxidase